MGKWSTILKTLSKKGWAVGQKVTESAPKQSLGGAVLNPKVTLKEAENAVKTVAVDGAKESSTPIINASETAIQELNLEGVALSPKVTMEEAESTVKAVAVDGAKESSTPIIDASETAIQELNAEGSAISPQVTFVEAESAVKPAAVDGALESPVTNRTPIKLMDDVIQELEDAPETKVMGKWATIQALGKKGWTLGRKAKNSTPMRNFENAVNHPVRTLSGAGTALKTASVGGAMGYVTWEALVNDKPVVRSVSEAVVGKRAVAKTVDAAYGLTDQVSNTLQGVQTASQNVSQTWSGLGSVLGNSFNTMGNFLGNLMSGNVSGISVLGLLLSGLLIFGHSGWLGKIAGAIMSMMLIGSNAETLGRSQSSLNFTEQTQQMAQSGGMKR
jgi:hypothetical protein